LKVGFLAQVLTGIQQNISKSLIFPEFEFEPIFPMGKLQKSLLKIFRKFHFLQKSDRGCKFPQPNPENKILRKTICTIFKTDYLRLVRVFECILTLCKMRP
jgi:hypothetical protein